MTLPVEFVALGRPTSVNKTTMRKKAAWMGAVHSALLSKLAMKSPPAFPYPDNVTVKIFFFPMNGQFLDIDNGLKHTIDAFKWPLLMDDKLVSRLITERFRPTPGATVSVTAASAPLLWHCWRVSQGLLGPRKYATAIRVEEHIPDGGALW